MRQLAVFSVSDSHISVSPECWVGQVILTLSDKTLVSDSENLRKANFEVSSMVFWGSSTSIIDNQHNTVVRNDRLAHILKFPLHIFDSSKLSLPF